MKNSTILILLGIGAVALTLMGARTAAKNLKFYFNGLDLKKSEGFTLPKIVAKFMLFNPASTGLTVQNITGDILVNDKQFGVIQSAGQFSVPGNSRKEYILDIRVPILSAVTSFLSFLKSGQKLKIEFSGTVNSGNIVIPVKQIIYQKK